MHVHCDVYEILQNLWIGILIRNKSSKLPFYFTSILIRKTPSMDHTLVIQIIELKHGCKRSDKSWKWKLTFFTFCTSRSGWNFAQLIISCRMPAGSVPCGVLHDVAFPPLMYTLATCQASTGHKSASALSQQN